MGKCRNKGKGGDFAKFDGDKFRRIDRISCLSCRMGERGRYVQKHVELLCMIKKCPFPHIQYSNFWLLNTRESYCYKKRTKKLKLLKWGSKEIIWGVQMDGCQVDSICN